MAPPEPAQAPATEALDCIFSHLAEGTSPVAAIPAPAPRTRAPSYEPLKPPAAGEPTPQLQAAFEWLSREKGRLEEYTRAQLLRIQEERQTVLEQHALNEQALILRIQELNRKEEFLTQQGKSLQEQAGQLGRREQALLDRLATESGAEVGRAFPADGPEVREDTAAQRSLLEALRTETAALHAARDSARADLAALEEALPAQREALNREHIALAARRAQVEQRALVIEREAEAMRRRMAELDEVEDQLRQELEAQERQLADERRDVAALCARLRVSTGSSTPT